MSKKLEGSYLYSSVLQKLCLQYCILIPLVCAMSDKLLCIHLVKLIYILLKLASLLSGFMQVHEEFFAMLCVVYVYEEPKYERKLLSYELVCTNVVCVYKVDSREKSDSFGHGSSTNCICDQGITIPHLVCVQIELFSLVVSYGIEVSHAQAVRYTHCLFGV